MSAREQPIVADSARLHSDGRRSIDLNAVAHAEYRARRARGISFELGEVESL